jgi:hypothetical protein
MDYDLCCGGMWMLRCDGRQRPFTAELGFMVDATVKPAGAARGQLSRRSHPGTAAGQRADRWSGSFLIAIFILSWALPIIFHAGPLRFSPYRLILVPLFVPCVIMWLSGTAGRIRAPDIVILLFCLWASVTLIVAHGIDGAWQGSGILLIETFGSYLLARCFIRDAARFRAMVRSLVWMVAILLPFALFEALTGRPILLDLFGQVFNVFDAQLMVPRHGLYRAQGPFEHPILFGVICSSAFALAYYVLGTSGRGLGKLVRPGLIATVVGTTMSLGAIVSLGVQLVLIGWDKLTRVVPRRWVKFAALVTSAYLTVDLLSNRNPFVVFIYYAAFDVHAAYYRVLIWDYGTQSVFNNPLFGIGLGDWVRPHWMHESADNFWLVIAMRHGLPGLGLLVLAFLTICFQLGRLTHLGDEAMACRKGLLISLVGLAVAAVSVHLWNATYSLFLFLLGSGVWLLDEEQQLVPPKGRHVGGPRPHKFFGPVRAVKPDLRASRQSLPERNSGQSCIEGPLTHLPATELKGRRDSSPPGLLGTGGRSLLQRHGTRRRPPVNRDRLPDRWSVLRRRDGEDGWPLRRD